MHWTFKRLTCPSHTLSRSRSFREVCAPLFFPFPTLYLKTLKVGFLVYVNIFFIFKGDQLTLILDRRVDTNHSSRCSLSCSAALFLFLLIAKSCIHPVLAFACHLSLFSFLKQWFPFLPRMMRPTLLYSTLRT